MTDCIRSLLINCSHLKELFIINHIKKKINYHQCISPIFLYIIVNFIQFESQRCGFTDKLVAIVYKTRLYILLCLVFKFLIFISHNIF